MARAPRVFRPAKDGDDVFVIGTAAAAQIPLSGPMATVAQLLSAAETRAAEILAAATVEAEAVVGAAHAEAAAVRGAARDGGREEGLASALDEAAALLDLLRTAASEGAAIRASVADEASGVITRALLLALRRITGDYYEEDPARTAAAVAGAVRAASGQEIVTIRVNPAAEPAVSAALTDLANYVRPDAGITVGGAIIDLRNGSIDATLDARLSLMELAITAASGEDL
ncbi:MAG TPA: FliH/SctL family protein [Tepidiformaceae bacterium]|nr:FliH/SctL family protein [Tepidiformaceae bacterium]